MRFGAVINGLCSGGNHLNVILTNRANSATRTISIDKSAFDFDIPDLSDEQATALIVTLFRSRCKQAGATTNAQRKTAIESSDFFI